MVIEFCVKKLLSVRELLENGRSLRSRFDRIPRLRPISGKDLK